MKKHDAKKLLIPIIITFALSIMCFFSTGLFSYANASIPLDYVGIEHFTEADGTVANIYASGDQYYNYLHDANGKILIPKDGFLYYATAENGRPAATATRWNASRFAVERTETMTAAELDLEKNPDLRHDFGEQTSSFSTQSAPKNSQLVNNVVFIRFPNESANVITSGVKECFSNTEGEQNTLRDYFQTISAGDVNIYNNLPILDNGNILIFEAPYASTYYQNVSDAKRAGVEGELLKAALTAAKPYLEKTLREKELTTDADADGKVDSIMFMVISDEPGSDAWNTLLWPHQWTMDAVGVRNFQVGVATASNYCFLFTRTSRLFAVMTHEMGHVLGAPDLYHYHGNCKTDPVGYYDNMCSSSTNPPNYWLTAMRDKYLGAVEDWQIEEIKENWDGYTLKAVSACNELNTLAYKIRLSASEWLYLEYRQPGAKYDKNLNLYYASAKAGLVAYRVVEGMNGNAEANDQGTLLYSSNPDEIYVYRNSDIATAALNSGNPSIGKANTVGLNQNGCINTKAGVNSGIVVTVNEEDKANDTVRFTIYKKGFPSYSGSAESGVMAGMEAESTQVEAKYGEAPNLNIYPVFLKGTMRYVGNTPIPAEYYALSGFSESDTSELPQKVTIEFLKDAQHGYPTSEGTVIPPIEIQILVKDYDKRLEVSALTAEEYLITTKTGFVASWKIVTAMGKIRRMNTESEEYKELTYSGFQTTLGLQTITVTYRGMSTIIEVSFYDGVVAFRYSGETSFPYNSKVTGFPFSVYYQSGKIETVNRSAGEVGFVSSAQFGRQTLSAQYSADGKKFTETFFVYIYKTVTGSASYQLVFNGVPAASTLNVRYADTVDLEGYALNVTFEDGSAGNFPLTERFLQKKIYTVDGVEEFIFPEIFYSAKPLSFKIKIAVGLRVNTDLLSLQGKVAEINYTKKQIILKAPKTVAELLALAKTANYLKVSSENDPLKSASGATIFLTNIAAGIELENFTFRVVLLGDANGDGLVSSADIAVLGEIILGEAGGANGAVGDTNGDGAFTLSDFARWLDKLSKEKPNPMSFFKLLISDGKEEHYA